MLSWLPQLSLQFYHPIVIRLVSPRLHRLPTHLTLESIPYNPGNRGWEVLGKLRAVWNDDIVSRRCYVECCQYRRDGTGEGKGPRGRHTLTFAFALIHLVVKTDSREG